jgi:hypothetical protein
LEIYLREQDLALSARSRKSGIFDYKMFLVDAKWPQGERRKMKRVIVVFAILLTGLLLAEYAAAQQPQSLVEITNRSGVKRKVCMYRENAKARTSPYKCFVINANQRVVWNRQGKSSGYLVRVFVSGRVLHERRVLAGFNRVLIYSTGILARYVQPKTRPTVRGRP